MVDVDFFEFMEYFVDMKEDKVIVFYIEGFKDGRKFIDVVKRVMKKKLVIVFKVGRSESGVRVVLFYMGLFVGSWKIYEVVFK